MEMLVSCLMAGVSSSDFEFKKKLYKDEASWQQYIDFTIDCLYKSLYGASINYGCFCLLIN